MKIFINLKYIILILCAATFACSCSNKTVVGQLDMAEAQVNEHPDSALVILESVNPSTIGHKAMSARYSLLYAMALDKNYIDTTNTEVIMPAVEYYGKHGTPDDKLKSYYYLGRIQYNGQDYNRAIVTFTKALEYGEKSADNRYKGRVNLAIADTYAMFYNNAEELLFISRAEEYFRKSEDDRLIEAVLCRKGMALAKSKDFTNAKALLLSVLESSDMEVRRIALVNLACIEVERKPEDVEAASVYFREALENGSSMNVFQYAAYAYTLAETASLPEAEQIFSALENIGPEAKVAARVWRSKMSESTGDYKLAFESAKSVWDYQDSIVIKTLSNSIEKAQRDYFQEQSRLLVEKSNNQLLKMLCIVLGLLISTIVLFAAYRTKLNKEKRNRERLIEVTDMARRRIAEAEESQKNYSKEIRAMHKEIRSKEDTIIQLRCKYTEMYKEQFRRLRGLCDAFFSSSGKTDSQRIVYKKVSDLLNVINGDESGKKQFEIMINNSLDNVMGNFRKDFPNYSENEYLFVSYLFVGFDATSLSLILDIPSVAAVYMRKSRIKKTIRSSQSRNKEKYLELLA